MQTHAAPNPKLHDQERRVCHLLGPMTAFQVLMYSSGDAHPEFPPQELLYATPCEQCMSMWWCTHTSIYVYMSIHILNINIYYVCIELHYMSGGSWQEGVHYKGEGQLRSPMAPILHMCTYIYGHH